MSSPVRVALNVAAIPLEALGAGQYAVELARALAVRNDVALELLARRDDLDRWRRVAPGAALLGAAPAGRGARLAWEELGVARALRGAAPPVEVLHGPHYALPALRPWAAVVTVHDLTFIDHPEWHERSKVAYFGRALRLAARRADVVVCVSERTAQRFIERFEPEVPVRVVHHGVDHTRFAPGAAPGDEAVRTRLGVRGRYVLHTGTIQPRKDLPSLVRGVALLTAAEPDLTLVLAGNEGWGSAALDEAIASSSLTGRVLRLGHVADDDVPALVRGAAAVAYPSLEEGFGLPALEAMACGAPLVTTRDSVMADLAGSAALLVAPSAPTELAAAIEAVLAGGPDVVRRVEAGRARAAAFTWSASAEGHVLSYREAISLRAAKRR